MKIEPVNLNLLEEIMSHAMTRGIPYKLGAKAPSLTCNSADIKAIDCSGFTRWAVARCTNQKLILPDGSQAQGDWCAANLKNVAYAKATGPDLYIAYIKPPGGKQWPRHVWLVRQEFTRESHGGKGVDERPWNTPVLVNNVSGCWILPSVKA